MTHFDRCAPGHVTLTPGQMQAKECIVWIVCLCVCTVYVNRYILCICMCVQAHLCACSFRTEGWAYERESQESRSQALTQQNTT